LEKIIGIDIGGSTTKIVGFDNKKIFSPMIVKANDPISSIYGAFGKFLSQNRLTLDNIKKIMITGVGSSFITEKIYGIPTGKVDEFLATGTGGLFLSGLEKAIVVSMGTGTALVTANGESVKHIGGTGVGGGTLLGLSSLMLNVRSFDDLVETAQNGNLTNIDLTIGDISVDKKVGDLPPETTASNFGKISDLATKADIGIGIINLVFQTIGMISVFATRIVNTTDVVLTGNLTNVPQSREIFGQLENIFGVKFHIPDHAEYATASGVAIVYTKNMPFVEI
jgi:type II pantothenate kinase